MVRLSGVGGSVLRRRDVRWLVVGRSVPLLGDELAVVGLTLWAYGAGWGTVGVAEMLVAATLPLAVGAPWAGRIVDRVDSRVVTTGAAGWQAACVLGLALASRSDGRHLLVRVCVLGLILLLNAGQAVAGPAWQSLVPHAVDDDEVGRTVSITQAAAGLASVLGPALGGVLVAAFGVTTALLADVACLLVVLLAATRVRVRRRPEPSAAEESESLWAGARALRADAVLGPLVLGLMAVAVFAHLILVITVFLVRDALGADERGYGIIMAIVATGAILGSLLAGRFDGTLARAYAVMGATTTIAAGIVLGGLAPALPFLAGAMVLFGVGQGVLSVSLQSLLLARTPDAVRGRVVAAMIGGVQTCTVIGMAVGGVLGTVVGPRGMFVGAGSVGLVVSLLVALRLRGSLRIEARRETEPASADA
jgi:predicted MFS family arabinose efflux permease